MNKIENYIYINESISTSGQPTKDQFKLIKENNFDVVINLALHNATNAIEDEVKVVTDLGMSYINIPVIFDEPEKEQLKQFINILKSFNNQKVWVHCAKNYRVTAFMYVFHKYILNTPIDEVDFSIFDEWTPSQEWQDLMKISYDEIFDN